MKIEQKDPRTQEIYRTLMMWLANRGPNTAILTIPVKTPGPAPYDAIEPDLSALVKMFQLRFRKVAVMGGTAYAQCLDDESITILYDPHWEDLVKIEQLLAAGDR